MNDNELLEKVKTFAKENGYDNVDYLGKYKEYKVFEPYNDGVFFTGLPSNIIANDSEIKILRGHEAIDVARNLEKE